jgi:hypothetical protein
MQWVRLTWTVPTSSSLSLSWSLTSNSTNPGSYSLTIIKWLLTFLGTFTSNVKTSFQMAVVFCLTTFVVYFVFPKITLTNGSILLPSKKESIIGKSYACTTWTFSLPTIGAFSSLTICSKSTFIGGGLVSATFPSSAKRICTYKSPGLLAFNSFFTSSVASRRRISSNQANIITI